MGDLSRLSFFPNAHGQSVDHLGIRVAGRDMVTHQPMGSPTFNFHYNIDRSDRQAVSAGSNVPGPQVRHAGSGSIPLESHASSRESFVRSILGRLPFFGDRSGAMEVDPPLAPGHSSASSSAMNPETQVPELEPSEASQPQRSSDVESGQPNVSLSVFGEREDFPPAAHRLDMSKAEAYVGSMLRSGEGLACWKPMPREPIQDGQGVVPGDVGLYSAEGSFRKIFNLWDDAASIQRTAATLGISYDIPQKAPNRISQKEHLEGDTIARGTTAKTLREADGRNIEGFEFCHLDSHPTGGVLAITSPTVLEELSHAERRMLFGHIAQYAELIYRYAEEQAQIGDDGGLYIVTTCLKSESWALAGFCDPMSALDNVLKLVRCHPSDAGTHTGLPPFVWTEKGTADGSSGATSVAGAKDQSLFLRGYKLGISDSLRIRISQTARHSDSNGGDDSQTSGSSAHGPHGARGGPGGPRHQGGGSSSGSSMLNRGSVHTLPRGKVPWVTWA